MFLWNSLAFSMIQWMLAIWSLVPLLFLNPAWTFVKFTVHVLLKPGLENFEHYFASAWDEYNYVVVWASLALPFFGIGMKMNLFQSCDHCWVFQICWHIECSTLTASTFSPSTRDPQRLAGRYGSFFCGVTAPFPWVLTLTRFCLCLPRVSVSPSPVEVL